jgi:hypothetical protein
LFVSMSLKLVVTCSSETWVEIQLTIRRYISEDRTLHDHRCENLKPYDYSVILVVHEVTKLKTLHFS